MTSTVTAAARARCSFDLSITVNNNNPHLSRQHNNMVPPGGKGQLLDGRKAASTGMRGTRAAVDLSSNQATDLTHPPGRQGKPLAKLKSKVSKGKALILGNIHKVSP